MMCNKATAIFDDSTIGRGGGIYFVKEGFSICTLSGEGGAGYGSLRTGV